MTTKFEYTMPRGELLKAVNTQKDLMIAVATGGPRIDSVNTEYKKVYQQIRKALLERGIEYPNPYSDLWLWYGYWSAGSLPSYQSRRRYLNDLFNPLAEKLSESEEETVLGPPREPTGWARVDRGIDAVRQAFESASTEEDFQAIGLRCRETLISLAQAVYNPDIHKSLGGVQPSSTDANRMLEAFIAKELSGSENNEAVRKHVKASLSLANDLVHRRTANFRSAALCSEATTSVVNIVAIISGRRDPSSNE